MIQRLLVSTVVSLRLGLPQPKFVVDIKLPMLNHFSEVPIQNLVLAIYYFCLD